MDCLQELKPCLARRSIMQLLLVKFRCASNVNTQTTNPGGNYVIYVNF